jgi:hypothetical protein
VKAHKDGTDSTGGQHNEMSVTAGRRRPLLSGEPDDLVGAHSQRAESHEQAFDSEILTEVTDSGIQNREVKASGAGRRNGRSLAAEGATAHGCAAVPHHAPPQYQLGYSSILTYPSEYKVRQQMVSSQPAQISD